MKYYSLHQVTRMVLDDWVSWPLKNRDYFANGCWFVDSIVIIRLYYRAIFYALVWNVPI